ncbi:tetratricopeptide repeat protein [Streptomyces luteireticuli]|uniref:tetratricopeptide repeat protein n=1 Tax=Streptomyces luteireticuli TaxID=173858 RepID=UPI003557CFB2
MGQPQQLRFVVLIRQMGLSSYPDFKCRYAKTAQRLGIRSRTPCVDERTFRRWVSGGMKGVPRSREVRRVLEAMFSGWTVQQLFARGPMEGRRIERGKDYSGTAPPFDYRVGDDIMAAADESARFAAVAEGTNVGPHTMDQLFADIERIVRTYPNRPVTAQFNEIRYLRDRTFRLLEGRQPPQYTTDLYLAAGLLCGVLANASFDLGQYAAAETQARTAFLCGELARHNGLRAWVRGLQALIAYWAGRPNDAVALSDSGLALTPEQGTPQIRLASIKARALGQLARSGEALAVLHQADAMRESLTDEGEVTVGMMAFPLGKQLYCASSAHLWLGGDQHLADAERRAQEAVSWFSRLPGHERRLGEESLARIDLALARLARGELGGAADQVHWVLDSHARRGIESVNRRLGQFTRRLSQHPAANSPIAVGLNEAIVARRQACSRALPSGEPS